MIITILSIIGLGIGLLLVGFGAISRSEVAGLRIIIGAVMMIIGMVGLTTMHSEPHVSLYDKCVSVGGQYVEHPNRGDSCIYPVR